MARTLRFARARLCKRSVSIAEPYQGISTMTCNPAASAACAMSDTCGPGETQSHAIRARLAVVASAMRDSYLGPASDPRSRGSSVAGAVLSFGAVLGRSVVVQRAAP